VDPVSIVTKTLRAFWIVADYCHMCVALLERLDNTMERTLFRKVQRNFNFYLPYPVQLLNGFPRVNVNSQTRLCEQHTDNSVRVVVFDDWDSAKTITFNLL
jgi:hypothetical protein